MQIPSIDQNICANWSQLETDAYNALPVYFMEAITKHRAYWPSWSKVATGTVNWKANSGDTMKTIIAEPTPVMRQDAYPQLLSTTSTADVISYRERTLTSQPGYHDFVSPHYPFYPEFNDYMNHIDRNIENITRQMTVYEEAYIRNQMFHRAPYMYIAGVGLVDAPTGTGNAAGTSGKTNAWLQAQIASLSAAETGYLSFEELFKALNFFEEQVGGTPFEGSGQPGGTSSPLNERFCLIQSAESWNNFVNDPWVKQNRPLSMDIVTGPFKGDLFGRIRSKIERYPQRYAIDVDFSPSLPAPEVTEENSDREDFGATKPNPSYSIVANAPIELAFLVGGPNFDIIKVGPPPSAFTKDLPAGQGAAMNWNGKPYMTKNFLIPCVDPNGTTVYQANSFGRYMRLQATATYGIRATNPKNVLPILFKRRVGISTT